jgi:hypothetical protein
MVAVVKMANSGCLEKKVKIGMILTDIRQAGTGSNWIVRRIQEIFLGMAGGKRGVRLVVPPPGW